MRMMTKIQCGGVEKIQRKGALVLLHLEVVLVFGKILRHGDEFVPDVIPPLQHLVGMGKRRLRRLVLGLSLTVQTHPTAASRVSAISARAERFIGRVLRI